jgi:hypothetical protein
VVFFCALQVFPRPTAGPHPLLGPCTLLVWSQSYFLCPVMPIPIMCPLDAFTIRRTCLSAPLTLYLISMTCVMIDYFFDSSSVRQEKYTKHVSLIGGRDKGRVHSPLSLSAPSMAPQPPIGRKTCFYFSKLTPSHKKIVNHSQSLYLVFTCVSGGQTGPIEL